MSTTQASAHLSRSAHSTAIAICIASSFDTSSDESSMVRPSQQSVFPTYTATTGSSVSSVAPGTASSATSAAMRTSSTYGVAGLELVSRAPCPVCFSPLGSS
eukprot:SAG31_NODE_12288_length_952_cov_1.249707_1_plen_101_part_10